MEIRQLNVFSEEPREQGVCYRGPIAALKVVLGEDLISQKQLENVKKKIANGWSGPEAGCKCGMRIC